MAEEEKVKDKDKKNQKITKFAVVLSRLRKERGISQKKAAGDLGISQALLSHYEKGIRECGLDFLIKCSEYYGVTTDYLLGISESRNGVELDLEQQEVIEGEPSISTLSQATNLLLKIIATARDTDAIKYIYDYYTLCVYRGALTMAKAGILPRNMFKIDLTLGKELASAAIAVEDARFVFIEDKSRTGAEFPEETPLHEIIESAEEHIISGFYLGE